MTEIEQRLLEAENVISGFAEYFGEIKKGGYSKSRPTIRVYELILLSEAESYIHKHKMWKILPETDKK